MAKTVKRFSWTAVDPVLTRRILVQAYTTYEQWDDRDGLNKVEDKELPARAERALGRPPHPHHVWLLAPVLLSHWLPNATAAHVKALAVTVQAGLGGAAKTADISTKSAALAFLHQRNHTRNFVINVRNAFLQSHKVPMPVVRSTTTVRAWTGPITIRGGDAPTLADFDHQREAKAALDALLKKPAPRRRGILVLPTGAGKTHTLVSWLLDLMAKQPDLRVLWVAHQQELLGQTAKRFQADAAMRTPSFERKARIVHSAASAASTLIEKDLDIVLGTVATLSQTSSGKPVDRFLARRTICVVDEAHHAGSPSYETLLGRLEKHSTLHSLIGLTATPVPTSTQAAARVRRRFGAKPLYRAEPTELIRFEVLAQPVITVVTTDIPIRLDDAEQKQAAAGDLAPATLAKLDDQVRDTLVDRVYRENRERWGKTLVFATSIAHADRLADRIRAHTPTKAIHSQSPEPPSEILRWFRSTSEPCVLVSVGMLTEGVDLPDATTAILARPTTSRVLLRQMVGRVMRGPKAGGAPEAQIVDIRDRWDNFGDVLYAAEAFPDVDVIETPPGEPRARRLAPIVDAHGEVIPLDLVAAIGRVYGPGGESGADDDDEDELDPIPELDPVLVPTRLVGYYQLTDARIPVLAHQQTAFEALGTAALAPTLGGPMLAFFSDGHPPYPTLRMVREFVAFVREAQELPELIPLEAAIGPTGVARQLVDAGAMTVDERDELIRRAYEQSLARTAYRSLEHFEDAVAQAVRDVRRRRFVAEYPLPAPARPKLAPLPRATRDLAPLMLRVEDRGGRLLPRDVRARWAYDYAPRWTKRPVATTFAHWSMTLTGQNAGQQHIRVNQLLESTPEAIPDDVLEYLLWHEVLHGLLAGQGHDWEFRDYESRWPDALEHDRFLDTLHERYDTRPERYTAP